MTRRLVVEVGTEQLRAELHRGARIEWEAAIERRDINSLEEQLRRLTDLAEGRALPRRLLVRLAAPLVQQRTLTDLPPVAPRELPGLVAHNATRFFRQNGHSLVTDGMWHGPRGGSARAAAVEDQVAEQVLQAVTAAGFELEDIQPVGDVGPRLSLLPHGERTRRRRARWRRTGLMGVVALAAWVLSLGAVAVRLIIEDRTLTKELIRLEAPGRSVARLRQEIQDAEAELAALAAAELERGTLALRMAELVEALPSGGQQRMVVDRGETEVRAEP